MEPESARSQDKHQYRLFRADAPSSQCNLGECTMTSAEAEHFNELIEGQSAKWFRVD
jgi:hypothetical protein